MRNESNYTRIIIYNKNNRFFLLITAKKDEKLY